VKLATHELREVLSGVLVEGQASDGESELDFHAGDITIHRPQRPDLGSAGSPA
jgi:hypothetical protein